MEDDRTFQNLGFAEGGEGHRREGERRESGWLKRENEEGERASIWVWILLFFSAAAAASASSSASLC